jgi:hypothetical protein
LSHRRRRRASARFGHDIEWIDAKRAESLCAAIRSDWPDLPDFLIEMESDHGVPGLITLSGVGSPGLTSRPAIAERIARLI